MKSLMLFLQEVLIDLGTWCGASTTLDYKTVKSRFEHEGMSFLTISLPNFGKDFEKSLDQGYVGDDQFMGFSRTGGLPRFLGGFLHHVFDAKTGRLLDEPSTVDIWAIRQITLMFGKILLPCKEERITAAMDKFIECEKDVKRFDASLDQRTIADFRRVRTLLFGQLLSDIDKKVYDGEVIPGHGPGSTAERILGNKKWAQREWTRRLDEIFPISDYLIPSHGYYHSLDHFTILEPGEERPVRVVPVPKTLKTPRIIAIEPVCMQYTQQGLLDVFVEHIQADDRARMLIGWQTSDDSHSLARRGSLDGSYATLDLSEASDRVSNQHVRLLLDNFGTLRDAVDACRSRKADVPGHGVIRLAKFASMGSALTFPMEAMVFLTVVFMGIQEALNRPIGPRDIDYYVGKVRVYGDDIIVPTEFAQSVVQALETFGFKVNCNKSFWTGKFRETCGREFYAGEDVSISRVRRVFPTNRLQAAEIVSTIELRNHLYEAGLWRSARHLDSLLHRLRIPMPCVLETSPAVGRRSFLGYQIEKMDVPRRKGERQLHRPLVKAIVVVPHLRESNLDDVPALLKVLTTRGDLPNPDVRHLQFAGRPRSVSTMTRWVTPY